jgi:hypothetical protein
MKRKPGWNRETDPGDETSNCSKERLLETEQEDEVWGAIHQLVNIIF